MSFQPRVSPIGYTNCVDVTKILQTWPKWPIYDQNSLDAVTRVIKSNQLFAATEVIDFENKFAQYIGTKFAVGVGNATQGLHLALAALEVGIGDEVITSPCSWISSASCILMQNAVPVFVDIEKDSLGLDPVLVKKSINKYTKAIILVHILGYPSRVEEIRDLANQFNIFLIEDASHAPGAIVSEKKLGSFGDISVFSLHQRKAISTGDGGVICTDNFQIAEKLRKLRSFGSEELSYNYRMTEFSAALAKEGLKKLDIDNTHRAWAASYLNELLEDVPWVRVRTVTPPNKGVYYAIAIELSLPDAEALNLLNHFLSLGVPMRKMFDPLNRHPHFNDQPIPSRGQPWRHPDYNGLMRRHIYAEQELPVSYEFCYGKILELYAHPGTTSDHLKAFAEEMKNYFEQQECKVIEHT